MLSSYVSDNGGENEIIITAPNISLAAIEIVKGGVINTPRGGIALAGAEWDEYSGVRLASTSFNDDEERHF
jgi:hypothetical protein